MNLPEKANLEKIYGENSACAARFQNLADNFARIYKHDHADLKKKTTANRLRTFPEVRKPGLHLASF